MENYTEAVSTGSPGAPRFVTGDGCWLFDRNGRRYFDGTAGSGAISLGHQHPAVCEAVVKQLERLTHTGCKLQSDVRERLVERIGELSPYQRCAVLFTVIGTEAVEASLKVARAYTGRRRVVAFRHAFHGKSAGAIGATWRPEFRRYSSFAADDWFIADFPDSDQGDEAVDEALRQLDQLLDDAAGDPPAAVIMEPVQITEGVEIPEARFLEGVIRAARRVGALAIFDEIYTGFGRCGTLFYSDRLAETPDLTLVGKSLGNGFPISLVLGAPEVINALPSGIQTSTYSGFPPACAAAEAVTNVMVAERLWESSATLGRDLLDGLRSLDEEHSFIVRPRGAGLALAFDCLDEAGRPSAARATRFVEEAVARGVLLFRGGPLGAAVKLVTPMLMDAEEHDFLQGTLIETAAAVAAWRG
ncbi:aspartate aminotransferase family protein [Halothiobacillus sp.]|uniref:aspartate aminotransferase family protein n=1 Tax=Halothiobacillus sp. TaxID=1891311 RepID=UPI00260E9906|nr:aspartate aminotransferase family protein [Halothiobacillus sp.]MDD4965737.1 aspartate aminotransferase family protein [Halothiobacillus sp.]